jgi:tetratricopeptide (TPR) repeat protein
VKAIVGEAAGVSPECRAALIEARCAGDAALLEEVSSLLSASDSSRALIHDEADAWVGIDREERLALPESGRLGAFVIERVIADHATAVVYAARQAGADRMVALKVLRGGLPLVGDERRFRLEAAAAARVEHPNVVRVYEAGVFDLGLGRQAPYLAMELVDGVPITEHARRAGLGVEGVVSLLTRVAGGLARIHQSGVIHRDLKPANVLVDRHGEPRILDFGIARILPGPGETEVTLGGGLLGTPGYMSPEQLLRPESVDTRADVWALGVLAYELLTGEAPFGGAGDTVLDILRRVTHGRPPPLRNRARGLGADLERVVLKALSHDPEARYGSVGAFASDLQNAVAHRPVSVRKPTAWYVARRFARRHAASVSVAVVAVALGVGVGLAQAVAWREAAREGERAEAVLGLMRSLIDSANPNFGNRDALMRDVLSQVEPRLTGRAGMDPITEAEIRSLLGSLSFGLGEFERALGLFGEAVSLRERGGEGSSAGAIADRARVGESLRWLSRPEEALAAAGEAVAVGERVLGAAHPATLLAREALAGSLHDLGDLPRAEAEFRTIWRERAARDGEKDEAALISRSNLATVLSDMGRYGEAEAEFRAVLDLRAAPEHRLESITTASNLARVVAEQGRLDEAISILRPSVDLAVSALGAGHPTALTARSNLIEFLRRRGDEAGAVAQMGDLLDRCEASHGMTHDLTLTAFTGFTAALVRTGEVEEALRVASRYAEACERALPEQSIWRARVRSSLAAALGANGRHGEGIDLHRESIEIMVRASGPTDRSVLVARNNLGVALIDAGRGAEAVVELEGTLAAATGAGLLEMEPTLLRNLGRALLAGGEAERGRESLEAAYRLSVERQESNNAAVCARLLAEFHSARDEREAAAVWSERSGTRTGP